MLVGCFPDLCKSIHSLYNSSMYSEVINNTSSNNYDPSQVSRATYDTNGHHFIPTVCGIFCYFTHYIVPFLALEKYYIIETLPHPLIPQSSSKNPVSRVS